MEMQRLLGIFNIVCSTIYIKVIAPDSIKSIGRKWIYYILEIINKLLYYIVAAISKIQF